MLTAFLFFLGICIIGGKTRDSADIWGGSRIFLVTDLRNSTIDVEKLYSSLADRGLADIFKRSVIVQRGKDGRFINSHGSFKALLGPQERASWSISTKEILPWLLEEKANIIICVADNTNVPQILVSAQRAGVLSLETKIIMWMIQGYNMAADDMNEVSLTSLGGMDLPPSRLHDGDGNHRFAFRRVFSISARNLETAVMKVFQGVKGDDGHHRDRRQVPNASQTVTQSTSMTGIVSAASQTVFESTSTTGKTTTTLVASLTVSQPTSMADNATAPVASPTYSQSASMIVNITPSVASPTVVQSMSSSMITNVISPFVSQTVIQSLSSSIIADVTSPFVRPTVVKSMSSSMIANVTSPLASPTVVQSMSSSLIANVTSPLASPTVVLSMSSSTVANVTSPLASPTVVQSMSSSMIANITSPLASPAVVQSMSSSMITNVTSPVASPTLVQSVSSSMIANVTTPLASPTVVQSVSSSMIASVTSPVASPTLVQSVSSSMIANVTSPVASPTVVQFMSSSMIANVTSPVASPSVVQSVSSSMIANVTSPVASPTVVQFMSSSMIANVTSPVASPSVVQSVSSSMIANVTSPVASPTVVQSVSSSMIANVTSPVASPTVVQSMSSSMIANVTSPVASPTVVQSVSSSMIANVTSIVSSPTVVQSVSSFMTTKVTGPGPTTAPVVTLTGDRSTSIAATANGTASIGSPTVVQSFSSSVVVVVSESASPMVSKSKSSPVVVSSFMETQATTVTSHVPIKPSSTIASLTSPSLLPTESLVPTSTSSRKTLVVATSQPVLSSTMTSESTTLFTSGVIFPTSTKREPPSSSSQVVVTEQPPVYKNETIVIEFEGHCNDVVGQKETEEQFRREFVNEVAIKLDIPKSSIIVSDVTCGSILVTFTITGASGKPNTSQELKKLVESGNFTVTVNNKTFKANKLRIVQPTVPSTVVPTTEAKNKVAFILYITFGALMAFIFVVGIIVLIVRCRRDRREGSFYFTNETNYELRRFQGIPRANSYYSRVNYYGEPVEMDATAANPDADDEFQAGADVYPYDSSTSSSRGKPRAAANNDSKEEKFNVGAMGLPEWKNLPKLSQKEVAVAEPKEGIPKSSGSVGSRELLLEGEGSPDDERQAYDNPVLTFGDGPTDIDKEDSENAKHAYDNPVATFDDGPTGFDKEDN